MKAQNLLALASFAMMFLTISCGDMFMDSSSPIPAPKVSASDDELKEMGKNIEEEFNRGEASYFDKIFNPVELAERIAWPSELSDEMLDAFMTGLNESLERQGKTLGEQLAQSILQNGNVRFLDIHRRDDGVKLLFRATFGDEGINYIEFLVGDNDEGEASIVDMYSTMMGENTSAMLRRVVFGNSNNPLVSLFGSASDAEERIDALNMLKESLQAGKLQEVLDIFDSLPKSIQEEKLAQNQRLQAVLQLQNDELTASTIDEYRQLFPNDPSLELVLMDFYTIKGSYDSLMGSIDRLDQTVQDPYLDVFRANVHLMQKEFTKASQKAHELISYDSTLMEPYYILITAMLGTKEHEKLADLFEDLQLRGMADIDFDFMEGSSEYKEFSQSEAYEKLKAKF